MSRRFNVPAQVGQPIFWLTPQGVQGWVPDGKIRVHGNPRLENPVVWRSRGAWHARIFVGLYVNGRPRWKVTDVVNFVRSVGAQGATFVTQRGLWHGPPERSVQVVIFNAPPHDLPVKEFRRAMVALGEMLCRAFQQDQVVVDVQKSSGRAYGVGP